MQIKSEPKFEMVAMTEISVAYPGGNHALTLEDGLDSCEHCDNGDIVVRLVSGETVTLEARNRSWYSFRRYSLRRRVVEPKEAV